MSAAAWASCGGPGSDYPKGVNSDGDDNGGSPSSGKADAGAKASGSSSGNGGATAPTDGLPPEKEQTLTFQTPQAGSNSVYVPNPTTNHVAVVNAGTFNIQNLAIGGTPTFEATVPGQDVALVLNVSSKDAAVLRTDPQGNTTAKRLDVGHDANAIAVAPDKKHAVFYLNVEATGATTGSSFQDLTIVDLTADTTQRVSVGFRPRAVQFTSDGSRAFVVTEDGISILDFAKLAQGSSIAPLVALGDTLADPQSIDVQVTPDGAFALSRREGDNTIRLINLADGNIQSLALAGPAMPADAGVSDGGAASLPALTDLDLSPDGTFAIAVLRDRGALVRIPIPGGFSDPTKLTTRIVTDQLIGSVTLSASGTRAVAYTTVEPVQSIEVIDLTSDAAPLGIRLRKAVRAVALTEDGSRALVLHTVEGNAGSSDPDAVIAASQGYSLVDTTTGFAKLQLTPAQVGEQGLLLTPDGKRVFALLAGTQINAVEMADLTNFQVIDVSLSAAPTSIGFVPGLSRVFVGQQGAAGITFLDATTGAKIRSVSGFEIASEIRQ